MDVLDDGCAKNAPHKAHHSRSFLSGVTQAGVYGAYASSATAKPLSMTIVIALQPLCLVYSLDLLFLPTPVIALSLSWFSQVLD